jgi:hypothetical protein
MGFRVLAALAFRWEDMARLEVSGDGIWVHLDPNGSLTAAWADIRRVSVYAWSAPPSVDRTVTMEISLANGEKVTLDEDSTEGFGEAMLALAEHGGAGAVDAASLVEDAPATELWRSYATRS